MGGSDTLYSNDCMAGFLQRVLEPPYYIKHQGGKGGKGDRVR